MMQFVSLKLTRVFFYIPVSTIAVRLHRTLSSKIKINGNQKKFRLIKEMLKVTYYNIQLSQNF